MSSSTDRLNASHWPLLADRAPGSVVAALVPDWAVTEESTVTSIVAFTDILDATCVDGLPHAAEPADAAWQQGYREGFAAGERDGRESAVAIGFEQGLAEGRARAAADMQQLTESVRDAMDRLMADQASVIARFEAAVVDLALDLAAAVLDRELAITADPGVDALRRALALAPERGAVLARLHPQDVARLSIDPALLAPGRELHVVEDATVGVGGCRLEVGSAQVDARISAALDRVRVALEGDR